MNASIITTHNINVIYICHSKKNEYFRLFILMLLERCEQCGLYSLEALEVNKRCKMKQISGKAVVTV